MASVEGLTRRSAITGGVAMLASAWTTESKSEMIEPSSPTEQMMYLTARIAACAADNSSMSFGTGFFFNVDIASGKTLPLLITNKHVVRGSSNILIDVHAKELAAPRPTANVPLRIVASLDDGWISHPSSDVDLCALPVGGALNSVTPPAFYRGLDASLVPSQQTLETLDAVEDVLMVGYPNGLWDETNNYPLIRKGITATHPAVPYHAKEYGETPLTVLDVATFPGSSGSPVFVYNSGSFANKTGGLNIGDRLLFLGVLFAGPIMQSDGKIIIEEVPTGELAVPRLNLMINLGYVINSSEIAALVNAVLDRLDIK